MVTTVKPNYNYNVHKSTLTLKECLQKINGDEQSDIPFLVWLLENPDSIFPLPGKINLYNHDCLHILLDRDISVLDEAFVVGFTMGSDVKTNRFHLAVFKFLSSVFYPKQYKFNREQFKLFDIAFNYGRKLKIKNLNHLDFKVHENKTVGELRKLFGIDLEEVKQCFALVS
ncbi:MAG: hypothetical protein QNJ34_00635 [Xenococcaceae cyanobacterium MO_188.B29]|nr:hypothetical protein [Xenococcaceae cyanobacterium MO_188.B29]